MELGRDCEMNGRRHQAERVDNDCQDRPEILGA